MLQLLYEYDYKSAGVDIKRADEIIKNIKTKFKMENLENFAGIFNCIEGAKFVSCCDGIGSKIIPLIEKNRPDIIAQDLIAMNLNDLITTGAKPLFFLDYIASYNLEGDIIQKTIENLKEILAKYNCALLGGEISELPDLISKKYFDIAGFITGFLSDEDIIDKNNVKKGDIVVAFESSGAHANGFSLIRKLYKDKKINEELFDLSLNATKIYADVIYKLNEKHLIKSAANITGGGIYENLKRAVPKQFDLKLDFNSLPKNILFEELKKIIALDECFRVFNMGAGFCIIADSKNTDEIFEISKEFKPFILGEVV